MMRLLLSSSHNQLKTKLLHHLPKTTAFLRTFSSIPERESLPFDIVIVGGGPAGLSASIRLKQLCQKHDIDLSICLIEKGSEIGSHILSGNVFEDRALRELLPEEDWVGTLAKEYDSIATPVTQDKFLVLSETGSIQIPSMFFPKQLHNDGNHIISLSQLCRYLAGVAEDLGVEIFPGFAASDVVLEEDGGKTVVKGITTRDAGIGKDGEPKENFEPGMNLLARQTLFAEGARGSCTQSLLSKFDLNASSHPQTYGLGLKEVWTVPESQFQSGLVQHTLGWPLQSSIFDKNFGGSFLYHQDPNLVLIGYVVGLDYQNPYLNPYREFQKFKTHPEIKKFLQDGECISYGARVLNEGGYHAIPRLTFPGGMLVGCSAGFLNSVKIKGTHTAMKSGMEAAESVFETLQTSEKESVAVSGDLPENEPAVECTEYNKRMETNWVGKELHQVRNCHQAFAKWGFVPGLIYSGLATHITKGKEPWTFSHTKSDSESTLPADQCQPITYPSPDGTLTFDLLTNLQRSNTYHEEDQPSHLRIKPELGDVPSSISISTFAGPEQRFCPAQVYEYVDDEEEAGKKKLVINAQNCIHCKCCSIKMPHEYIHWTVPEGGGGPQYQVM